MKKKTPLYRIKYTAGKDKHTVEDVCPNCDGRGDINIGAKVCPVCGGTGKIVFEEVGKIIRTHI